MAKIGAFEKNLPAYEEWFTDNHFAYLSELEAIKQLIPKNKKGVEIGIGSGIFAEPLGIINGIDPSPAMRTKALERGLNVTEATAEQLPYKNISFDFALMVTAICFVDNVVKSLNEIYRILKPGGEVIIGFVDKNSPVGKIYLKHKNESLFYNEATFFSTDEIISLLKKAEFSVDEINQTIFGLLHEVTEIQMPEKGFGEGSFVVIKAKK